MSEYELQLLSIERVDVEFIEKLRRTAPPEVRVDHHKLVALSAGPF